MKKIKNFSLPLLTILMAACASPATKQATDAYAQNDSIIQAKKEQDQAAKMSSVNTDTTYERVKGIYLGAKSVSLRNDLLLPDVFMQPKLFSVSGSLTLSQAIAEISNKSGISVRLAADVMPATTGTGQANAPQPGLQNITLNTTTSTKNILDQLTSDAGLSWEYSNSSGVVTVQRTVTKLFRLKSALGETTVSTNTGSTGMSNGQSGSGGGITSGFSTNVQVFNLTKIDPLKSINDAVKTFLSKSGSSITTVTNSIVVTDSVDVVGRVGDYISREDEILSRNANIRVQIFSFTANDADSANLNLVGLYQDINKVGFGFSSPTSISNSGGVSFSAAVLSGAGKSGHTDGSKAFVDALSQKGRVAVVHDLNVPITNLNLYALSIPRQITYLAKTTPTPGTIAGTTPGTPGLETQTITYGFKLALLGNILDSNTMRLKFNLGLLDLLELRKIDTGTGINLQSPDLAGFEMPADLVLRPNETAMVTGFEHVTSNYNRNGIAQDLPLLLGGGSYNANTKSEKYFIMITPTIARNTQ
jgi:type IVB pilus formation R64 PilN family outer membrane protein